MLRRTLVLVHISLPVFMWTRVTLAASDNTINVEGPMANTVRLLLVAIERYVIKVLMGVTRQGPVLIQMQGSIA
jgi:hypothetical protein